MKDRLSYILNLCSFFKLYHLFLTTMIHFAILCGLLLTVPAGAKDKKTTLEDIERDYLSNQKRTKLTSPLQILSKVPSSAPSPTQFGFVPIKTLVNYVQQGPKQNYIQPHYTQQFVHQYPGNDYSQSAIAQQYSSTIPQRYSSNSQQYTASQYSSQQQKYIPQSPPQQSYVTQVQNPYQSYENVQYITDNSIGQTASQYYTPQYVYLQQYQAPSTAVQTVVDPKGGLQYVMYIPTYVPTPTTEQTSNYENVVYTTDKVQDSSVLYQVPQGEAPQTTQYITQKEQIQYVQPKRQHTKADYVPKSEPKSLLDSYVPSILQLQYYKQAQQNSIQEPEKVSQAASGKHEKNGYRSADPTGTETSVAYAYQTSSYKS